MDISKRILEIREGKKIKQIEIAEKLSMDRQNYSRLEKRGDKLSIEQLKQIADALGVSLAEILGIEGQSNNETGSNILQLEQRIKELEDRIKDKEFVIKSFENEIFQTQQYFTNYLLEKIAEKVFFEGLSKKRFFITNTNKTILFVENHTEDTVFQDYLLGKINEHEKYSIEGTIEELNKSKFSVQKYDTKNPPDALIKLVNEKQIALDRLFKVTSNFKDFENYRYLSENRIFINFEFVLSDQKELAINKYFFDLIGLNYDETFEPIFIIINSNLIKDPVLVTAIQRLKHFEDDDITFEEFIKYIPQ